MITEPKVGVVILNYRLKDQVVGCVESVLKSSYKNLLVIVVDNDSKDGMGEALAKFESVKLIQSGGNFGYTGGNNLGIKYALGEGCDYVFVLNPDTVIASTTIKKLVDGAIEHQAGIVGPKIYFKDSKVIWFAGGELDLANVIGGHTGVDQEDKGQFDKVKSTDYITGAAMLVKAEVFEKIGLFDERFFLYYEDSDFSYRAKKAGFKLIYLPSAVVDHANAQTTGIGSPRQDYYITRNRMLFATKHLKFRTQFALWREAVKSVYIGSRRKALFDFSFGRWGNGKI